MLLKSLSGNNKTHESLRWSHSLVQHVDNSQEVHPKAVWNLHFSVDLPMVSASGEQWSLLCSPGCLSLDDLSWNQTERRDSGKCNHQFLFRRVGRHQKGMSVISVDDPQFSTLVLWPLKTVMPTRLDDTELNRYFAYLLDTTAHFPVKPHTQKLNGDAHFIWSLQWVLWLKLSCLCTSLWLYDLYDCRVDRWVTSLCPTHNLLKPTGLYRPGKNRAAFHP